MSNQTKPTSAQLYAEAGLIYIRAPSKVETKTDGKTKKIRANPYPKDRNLITEQPKYNKGSGDYYALLMGREFRPGRFVLLLDFDNKEEEGSENGMKLLDKLQMDSRGAPCQKTPSGGKHYLVYANAVQKESITARTTITYQGVKYNMDVKFKNGLCNCTPTKIEGYGKYIWTAGSAEKLKNIPQLPKDLFELITGKTKSPSTTPSTRTPASTPTRTPASTPTTSPPESPRAGSKQLQDFRSLCSCLSLAQLDNYDAWVRVGMILKSVGAPFSLWDQVSQRSKKYKQHGSDHCSTKWRGFKGNYFTVGSLCV